MVSNQEKKLYLGLPKGSLQEATFNLFERAGFEISAPPRCYRLKINDPEIEAYLLRPQEIPLYVEEGKLDVGISGYDWILESEADVFEICDLAYAKNSFGKVKWVLAVADDSDIKKPEDLDGKRVATEIVNITEKYFQKRGVKVKIEFSWGASEAKPPRFADAIVDLTETGKSLQANKLRVLDIVFESSTKLIAHKKILKEDSFKKKKIESLALLLKAALKSQTGAVKVMVHIPSKNIDQVLKILPQSHSITIKKIEGDDWYEVSFVCFDKKERVLIPQLKRLGCHNLVQFPSFKCIG